MREYKTIYAKQLLIESPEILKFNTSQEFFEYFGYAVDSRAALNRSLDKGWFSPKNNDDLYEVWRDVDTDDEISDLEHKLEKLRNRIFY